jgi:hypothetical protein
MGTGSQYTSSNKQASFDSVNRKTKLIDSGTAIQAANKIGVGQDAFCESGSAGLSKGTNYELVATTHWQSKLASLLFPMKWGQLMPISSTEADNKTGIVKGTTLSGTLGIGSFDNSHGKSNTFTSGAVGGNQAGLRTGATYTQRGFNPTFAIKWKLDEAGANIRFYAGWTTSGSAIANSDDPLNAAVGFGIAILTTQTNYRIIYNDGAGSTVSTDTGIAKDTLVHTFLAWGDENGQLFWWSLDDSTPASISTDIPASTNGLASQFTATAVNADAKVLDVYNWTITSER